MNLPAHTGMREAIVVILNENLRVQAEDGFIVGKQATADAILALLPADTHSNVGARGKFTNGVAEIPADARINLDDRTMLEVMHDERPDNIGAEAMREALEWYGERRNYLLPTNSDPAKDYEALLNTDSYDGKGPGARARSALRALPANAPAGEVE